jgi:plastocyanin
METKLTGLLRRGMIAGAIAAALAVAGCGGSSTPSSSAAQTPATHAPATHAPATHAPASSASGQQVTITGTNSLRFMPMTVHVHAGRVRITLMDMGAYPHNVVIPQLDVTSTTVTGDPGGAQATFTVTFAHPGRYPFHCQYHASAGMTGVFVVS